MYLDPYGNDKEIPFDQLRILFLRFGGSTDLEKAVSPAHASSIVNRTGLNMSQTYAVAVERNERETHELTRVIRGSSSLNLYACLYASMWAALILTNPETWAELDFFLTRLVNTWPEDAWLVEKYLVPRNPHRRVVLGRHAFTGDAWKMLRSVQHSDGLPAYPLRRNEGENDSIPFRVGQIFRHKRYGYLGVIVGWSDQSARARRAEMTEQERQEVVDPDPLNRISMDGNTYFIYL